MCRPPAGFVLIGENGGRLRAAAAAAQRVKPDVILADVMMPGLDGFELLRRVREHPALQHTPVILLTARVGEEAAIKGFLAGADTTSPSRSRPASWWPVSGQSWSEPAPKKPCAPQK